MTCRNYENYWSVLKAQLRLQCLHVQGLPGADPEKDSNVRGCWADDPREDGRGVNTVDYLGPKLSPVLRVQCDMCFDMWEENRGALNGLTTGSSPNSVPTDESLNQELSSSQDQMQFPFIPYQWASVTANPQNYSNKSSSHKSQQAPLPLTL